MIITTSNWVPGYKVVKTIGYVQGLTVRSRGLGGNIVAAIRSLFGGEIHEYVDLCADARDQAIKRMIASAEEKGANAIISLNFDSNELATSMNEIIVFGTAVVVQPEKEIRSKGVKL
jgi:uncharacterized protein YbjQ (UPF0145 family)